MQKPSRLILILGLLGCLLLPATGWSLPPCKDSPSTYYITSRNWTDCFGTYTRKGNEYVGEWKYGKRHGQGTFTSARGKKYVGEWKGGKPHGQVTLTYADGRKYVGEWKDGKRHGYGTFTRANGRIIEGIWENGKFVRTKKEQIARENKRKKEQIARENKQKREQIARENKRKKEQIARENKQKREQIAREKQSASNPGFRDLKPGLHRSTIKKKEVCMGSLSSQLGTTCYGLDNLKFFGTFDKYSLLEKLTVDLGPYVQKKGKDNIYLKMRNGLGAKYKMDFEFSERDRQLFNEGVKGKLYTVYNGGQVALLIGRKKRGSSPWSSSDLWLYVEYRDVKPGQRFLKSTKPKRAKTSDF